MTTDRILTLRLSALGDVAMTLPAIYSTARRHAQARLTVVTRPFFRQLFIDPPANVDFIDCEATSLTALWRFIGQLRREEFTAVADLHDVLRTRAIRAVLALQKLPVETVDKDRRARKHLTDKKGRDFQRNYVERYFDVFRRLGFPADDTFEGFYQRGQARRGVGIAPFARYMTKTYPPALMERVARKLTDAGVEVTLFGGRGDEAETLARWAARNPALNVAAGKLTLPQELEAMSGLQVMLTMDSANMHLASLVRTPAVSVWGSTIPQCGFLGWGQTADNAVWLDLPCQPCSVAGLESCPIGHYACLERIEPKAIANKILTLINQPL